MTSTLERPAPEKPVGGTPMVDRAEGWRRRAPLLPALVFTIIVTQIPFILTLYYSLQSWNLVRPGSQEFVGFSNYGYVFADSQFRQVALNTVVMTLGSVLIAVVLGLLLALLLNREFVGRGVVRTLLITPFLITPVAAALLWRTVLLHLHEDAAGRRGDRADLRRGQPDRHARQHLDPGRPLPA